jgi:hypothetical protein
MLSHTGRPSDIPILLGFCSVMGFCTAEHHAEFIRRAPLFKITEPLRRSNVS